MQSPGHHYNGYCASIIGVALNVITGNFDVPGGVIDTELVKSDKGGSATGKQFKKKKVKRMINGKEVEGEVGTCTWTSSAASILPHGMTLLQIIQMPLWKALM